MVAFVTMAMSTNISMTSPSTKEIHYFLFSPFHIIPTLEELRIVLLFLVRTLSLSNFSYPFIKPIAKPAFIPLASGIPKLVIANDSILWSLRVLVVAFANPVIVPSILSQLKEAIC
jgi:hypothetical protein